MFKLSINKDYAFFLFSKMLGSLIGFSCPFNDFSIWSIYSKESSIKNSKLGIRLNWCLVRCANSCLIKDVLDLIPAKSSLALSLGKILKYTLATDKSTVTFTLETDIN